MSFPPHCQSIQPSLSHSKAEERDHDKLLVENRKLADENCQLKLQILDLTNKLSREIKKHSKATAMINNLKWWLNYYDDRLEYLDLQLEERDQWIKDQANKIAFSDKLISNIYYTIRESKKYDL